MQREKIEEQVQKLLVGMDERSEQEHEPGNPGNEGTEEIQDIYVLIVREREEEGDQAQVVDSTLVLPQKISFLPAYAFCGLYLLLIVSTLAFQRYSIVNPPIATVTIVPKSQTVTLTDTLQLGRLLQPITISQSQTVSTTGKGHQDAKEATGSLTFYNGLSTSQSVQEGTVLTGQDGIRVVTDYVVTIPPANPPNLGEISATAHAENPGSAGNIQAGDINTTLATGLFVKNTQGFTRGQDARYFTYVTQTDIESGGATLKPVVTLSMQAALQGQVGAGEQLFSLPCSPTTSANHQAGTEATRVQLTVTETCTALVYNTQQLTTQATRRLTAQALKQLGSGYSLFGTIQISVSHATITRHTPSLVLSSQGVWVCTLSDTAQQHIKSLMKGKAYKQALQILQSLPSIEKVSIAWDENTKFPKDSQDIHLVLIAEI